MKTKLLIIFVFFFASQVFAEQGYDWTPISSSTNDRSEFYGDKNSIRKNKSGNYIVWVLANDGKERDSFITSEEYDCAQLRYRWLYLEHYTDQYGKGKIDYSFDTEQLKSGNHHKWFYPKPGSNNYHKVNWVCKPK